VSRLVERLWVAIAITLELSCKRSATSDAHDTPKTQDARPAVAAPAPKTVLDIVRDIDRCAIGHSGVLLDFGEPSLRPALSTDGLQRARPSRDPFTKRLVEATSAEGSSGRGSRSPIAGAPSPDDWVEHDGATWFQVRSRTVSTSFYWPAVASASSDVGGVYVEARLRGIAARSAVVAVDGKSAGSFSLRKAADRIVIARAAVPLSLTTGGHELTLRFLGTSRTNEPLAEIDWVHVGTGQPVDGYSAPTISDTVHEVSLGGASIRSLSLRAPGFVRCSTFIPANATLEVSLGTSGAGDAEVEARLVRDRRADIVLGAAHVDGGGQWLPWSVPIAGLESSGALAAIELSVRRASNGTRAVFGAPRIVVPGDGDSRTSSPARSAVIVVMGSTAARSLAPWGGPHAVPELSRVAATGTTFMAHRASSSLVSAVVGSMLTGLSPSSEALLDPFARLPSGPTTVEDACREAGIATAMFTANPTTSGVYGFSRGWDDFVEHSPLESVPATRVFDDAAAWIETHKGNRFLVVVHARGGHPPWDVTPDELKAMPPLGYFGAIEPGRAAEALRKARKHSERLKDDDRTRAWALYDRAVDDHDEALGRLLATLQSVDDSTAVVITGDVATSEALPVPFLDTDGLEEAVLAAPLVVRWPRSPGLSGRRVEIATSSVDVSRTILGALGLASPPGFGGADLRAVVGYGGMQRSVLAAREERESIRWGPFVALGVHHREARMCDLSLNPACTVDVRATAPLALEALRRALMDAHAKARTMPVEREPAPLDAKTSAALVRWGWSRSANDVDE